MPQRLKLAWLAVPVHLAAPPLLPLSSSSAAHPTLSVGPPSSGTRLSHLLGQLSLDTISYPLTHPAAPCVTPITGVLPEHVVGAVNIFPFFNSCHPATLRPGARLILLLRNQGAESAAGWPRVTQLGNSLPT